jgi:uncharacterized membrane protein
MVTYNKIAGQSLHRLEALSDGVFAVAMTLLVLELHTPVAEAIHDEASLWHALVALLPRLMTYMMSFLTLGIFWIGQQTQHSHLAHSDRAYGWLSMIFLMAVTLVPFSTALLAEFVHYRIALLVYWFNILMLGVVLGACWYRARNFGLLKLDVTPEVDAAIYRRIFGGQTLYVFGAALCVFHNYWSIIFIIAVQMQYAIGFRFWPFSRI